MGKTMKIIYKYSFEGEKKTSIVGRTYPKSV
jgi:hypothetical protein